MKKYDLLIQCESVCYFSLYPSGRWDTEKSLLFPLCVLFTVLSEKTQNIYRLSTGVGIWERSMSEKQTEECPGCLLKVQN